MLIDDVLIGEILLGRIRFVKSGTFEKFEIIGKLLLNVNGVGPKKYFQPIDFKAK